MAIDGYDVALESWVHELEASHERLLERIAELVEENDGLNNYVADLERQVAELQEGIGVAVTPY